MGSKASGAASGASTGASVGGTIGSVVPVIGTAIGAAVGAVVGGIAGALGAKGTYSEGTGYRVTGTYGASGFSGTVYGLSANAGDKYVDALADQPTLAMRINERAAPSYGSLFGGTGAVIPIDVTSAPNSNAIFEAVKNAVQRFADPSNVITASTPINMQATDVSAITGATDATGANPATPGLNDAIVAPAAQPLPPNLTVNNPLLAVGLLVAGIFFLKG